MKLVYYGPNFKQQPSNSATQAPRACIFIDGALSLTEMMELIPQQHGGRRGADLSLYCHEAVYTTRKLLTGQGFWRDHVQKPRTSPALQSKFFRSTPCQSHSSLFADRCILKNESRLHQLIQGIMLQVM